MKPKTTNENRRWDFETLTPAEFSDMLNDAGISVQEFHRMTGSNPKRIMQWLSGESPDMPFWIGSFLTALLASETAAAEAWEFAEARTKFRDRDAEREREKGSTP